MSHALQHISWQLSSGHKIHAQIHSTVSAKAVVGIAHGMGGHFGRYNHLRDLLLKNGYHVAGFDQLGHGRSEGKRGDTPKYELLVENFSLFTQKIKSLYPKLPLVLFAHSMGGNVLINYLLQSPKQVDLAIVSAPWIKLVQRPDFIKIRIARFIAKFHPSFLYSLVLRNQALSRDKEFLENYFEDKWCHSKISIRFFFSMVQAGRRILKNAPQLNIQTYLYHGTSDKITSHKASQKFYDLVTNKNIINFDLLDGVYHEPHNDLGKQKVYSNILNTISQKLGLDLIA